MDDKTAIQSARVYVSQDDFRGQDTSGRALTKVDEDGRFVVGAFAERAIRLTVTVEPEARKFGPVFGLSQKWTVLGTLLRGGNVLPRMTPQSARFDHSGAPSLNTRELESPMPALLDQRQATSIASGSDRRNGARRTDFSGISTGKADFLE
ncbi:MAG: hypothetical protein HQ582_17510 [Planctomycetes bacterium]|nr:hypothetical protein [Planctomycetota bacterium]